jgi:hypothetical protein
MHHHSEIRPLSIKPQSFHLSKVDVRAATLDASRRRACGALSSGGALSVGGHIHTTACAAGLVRLTSPLARLAHAGMRDKARARAWAGGRRRGRAGMRVGGRSARARAGGPRRGRAGAGGRAGGRSRGARARAGGRRRGRADEARARELPSPRRCTGAGTPGSASTNYL